MFKFDKIWILKICQILSKNQLIKCNHFVFFDLISRISMLIGNISLDCSSLHLDKIDEFGEILIQSTK